MLGYLVPEFPTQTHAFFWREMQALEAGGLEVSLISTRRPPEDACPHDFADAARARTHYVFPPSPGPVLAVLATRPLRVLRGLAYAFGLGERGLMGRLRVAAMLLPAADLLRHCRARGVDHVHFHSCADSAHIGALARILGGPAYSLTLHGDLPVYGTDHAAKMARARAVTAVTRPLADQIRAVHPDRDVPVVWMGVDTDRFRPAPSAGGADGGPLHVVTIARLNPTKGHVHFLEAMARLVADGVDIRYTIAGEGPHRASIEADIARLGLSERVEMAGSIGEDQVIGLLARADAFALTSFGQGEAAPVSVMEAMAAGLAVICSRIGGTPDMITDGVDGLLTGQSDVAAIAAALRRLTDPEQRRRLADAARQTALTRFDYRQQAMRLREAVLGK